MAATHRQGRFELCSFEADRTRTVSCASYSGHTASGETPEQQEQASRPCQGARGWQRPQCTRILEWSWCPPSCSHSGAPAVGWAGVCPGGRAEPLHGGEVGRVTVLGPLLKATWRAGEGNQSCFSLLSKLLAFGSRVNLWGRAILWYSSCIYGRLFGAEQGDGYYKSGVGACSTPEWCLVTEPW